MGKKGREQREKKLLEISKSREERQAEMDLIKTKLWCNLGLTSEQHGMAEIGRVIDDFVETGESISCAIKLPGTQRICQLKLANRKTSESIVNLAYRSDV